MDQTILILKPVQTRPLLGTNYFAPSNQDPEVKPTHMIRFQSKPLPTLGTAEEVWTIGAWLVETIGIDHPSLVDEASSHIEDDPSNSS